MSHNESKQKWDSLSDKEKERLWQQTFGTGLIPDRVSGTQLDNLFKTTNNEKNKNCQVNQADNPWRIPD